MLIKYSLKDPAIIFSPKRRSWTGSNALCCRVIVEKNPLPIWPEFVRRLGLSLLHPAEERGWEHSAKLQQQNPIHPSYFPVMLSGPPAFLFAVCIRASMQCNVSFPLYLPPREHPPALSLFPAYAPSATPRLWSMQCERNCVQTIAPEKQPVTSLTFALSPTLPHKSSYNKRSNRGIEGTPTAGGNSSISGWFCC